MKRKGFTTLTAVIMALICATSNLMCNTASAATFLWGDVNSSGDIDAADANIILLRYVRELAHIENYDRNVNWSVADVTRDGVITAEDAQLVLQKYVNRLAKKDFILPAESPILYTNIFGTETWYVYEKPNTSIKQNRVSVVEAFTKITILQYIGNYWYRCEDCEGYVAYINIPESAWRNIFFYCDDMEDIDIVIDSTTATTTTTTTEATTTTTTSVETTTTTTTATTTSETTTSTATTATTEETTTTTTTTQPAKPMDCFEVGDVVQFHGLAWWLYSKDFGSEPYLTLHTDDTFKVCTVKKMVDSYWYDIEFKGLQLIIKIADTSRFEKIS